MHAVPCSALSSDSTGSVLSRPHVENALCWHVLQCTVLAYALLTCRLAEKARQAEHDRREAAAKAAEYEKAALEELERLRARRAAAKKVWCVLTPAHAVMQCTVQRPEATHVALIDLLQCVLEQTVCCWGEMIDVHICCSCWELLLL